MTVLGVDACPAGWVGVVLERDGTIRACCRPTVESVLAASGTVDVVGVDIPVGLPGSGVRLADVEARRVLGARRSSVFLTPPRAVLQAASHSEASALCRALTGSGVSQQTYALRAKVLEVDEWLARRGETAPPVFEVHPEVSFVTLAGAPLESKKTWAGFDQRRRVLAGAGIVLEGGLGLSGQRVGVDDLLDAAVVAWTAQRIRAGTALCMPSVPEPMPDGKQAAIWA
ncbi:MAG TPA: DUF429 domain-containing protein [Acidimicrobiales bacterium]